jgi:type II secretory pathway pseudopilin PulG
MPPVMPNYDLGLLITLDIGLAILGLLLTFAGIWAIIWQLQRNARESREGIREITQITREVALESCEYSRSSNDHV